MLQYERGSSINLYSNFLTIEGKEAINIVNPKITIRHIDSNNLMIIDINEFDMSFGIETLYYFKWQVPAVSDLGVYTVEYQATVDGIYAEANEQFEIVSSTSQAVCSVYYTTAAKVATYLGVTADKISTDCLLWSSRYIDMYTRQQFCSLQITQKYDITECGQKYLFLDKYPLISVLEVKNNNTIMDLNDLAIYNNEGMIKIKEVMTGSILQDAGFLKGNQTVSVIYKYGYETTPVEIEFACTVLAAHIAMPSLIQVGTVTQGDLVEEQIGDYRRKFSESNSGGFSSSISLEKSKSVSGRLEEDVFSAKNILKCYRQSSMGAV